MATVPQRALRNDTADILRRVEAGESVRITSNGRPVADLVPINGPTTFVPLDAVVRGLGGVLRSDDRLDDELRERDTDAVNPFA
jgi:prevent-host-death family protein